MNFAIEFLNQRRGTTAAIAIAALKSVILYFTMPECLQEFAGQTINLAIFMEAAILIIICAVILVTERIPAVILGFIGFFAIIPLIYFGMDLINHLNTYTSIYNKKRIIIGKEFTDYVLDKDKGKPPAELLNDAAGQVDKIWKIESRRLVFYELLNLWIIASAVLGANIAIGGLLLRHLDRSTNSPLE